MDTPLLYIAAGIIQGTIAAVSTTNYPLKPVATESV